MTEKNCPSSTCALMHSGSIRQKRPTLAAMMVAGLLAIAGCESNAKVDPLAGGGGLAGSWRSADGVFTAELLDGQFVSRANDTGEVLSQGRYIVTSSEIVRLEWRSIARNEDSVAECRRDGVANMSCTDQAGRTFSLVKVNA